MESFLSLGRFHIPLYALCGTAGLLAAMLLGLRTAVLARIDRNAFWDLGFVTVIAAFILSRLVLIVENPRTFLSYPITVLELPAITKTGILLTLVVAVVYLYRRALPLLGAMDAAAPCAALLCVFLSLGRIAEGTREGMPTTVPWSVPSSFGRVHPVELYSAVAWLIVGVLLMGILRREPSRGITAGVALMLAGLVLCFTDFFRLPGVLYGHDVLDGVEWRGLEMIVLGGILLAWRLAASERTDSAPTFVELRDAI